MGWDYNSHIVCMCIIMRWSRNHSASWAERFWTSSSLCTYKLCDYYTPIPILSLCLFTPSLYALILNLQDFSFTCKMNCHRCIVTLCAVSGATTSILLVGQSQNSKLTAFYCPQSAPWTMWELRSARAYSAVRKWPTTQ